MTDIEITTKWIYPMSDAYVKNIIENLSKETGLSKAECSIFYNRRIRTSKEIKRFLNLGINDMLDPKGLKDIVKVAEVVIKHLKAGNEIVLYSDYDADGWGCVIVFVKLMKKLGYKVNYFTNERSMGYGISPEGVDKLMDKFPNTKLILTADNGIVGFEGIDYAVKDLGIEVCVTDHHEPSPDGRIPECSGVVNPKRLDETYGFNGLCGTGVVYKLCQVIYELLGKNPKACESMIDIVAVATVADVVPMLEENRIIVKEGLKRINSEEKNIWRYMREILMNAQYETSVTSKTIGFTYGPSINACSRLLGNMNIPIEVFLHEDSLPANENIIRTGIEKMKSINLMRKDLSDNQTKGVMSSVMNCIDEPIYLIWHEELHEGIVGIIAGRVCERFNKPTIVMTTSDENPGVWKGSGRSIPGFNIKEVLDDIQSETGLLEGYGGHEGACGVSVAEENLENFKLELVLKADELLDSDTVKEVYVDFTAEDEYYSVDLFDNMKALEPYGQEFKSPIYGIKNFNPIVAESFGGEERVKHVKFSGKNVEYIGWNCGEAWKNAGEFSKNINAIGELSINSFNQKIQISTREYSDISHN